MIKIAFRSFLPTSFAMEPVQAIVFRRLLARASLTRDDEIIYLQNVPSNVSFFKSLHSLRTSIQREGSYL